MSNLNPNNLPYQARRPKSRPNKPLPPPPPSGDDVDVTNSFEQAQAFTSPPSPPRPTSYLPPPPRTLPAPAHGRLHPHTNTLDPSTQPPTTLTPLRAHYLKKTLVNLQMSHELNLLTDPVLGANALGLLGDPFTLTPSAKKEALARVSELARSENSVGDLPYIRFLFHQFLLPFPFLATAPSTFWSAKVQPFLSSFLMTTGYARQTRLSKEDEAMQESLMTKEEKKESEERKKMWAKVEKHLGLMVGVGVKVVGGEEVVRIGQGDLRRLEERNEERRKRWVEKRRAVQGEGGPPGQEGMVLFEVNVVGVRVVVEKGRVRSKSHDEFLIRTKRPGVADVFVSRRYGDFKRLGDELRLAFPDYPLPLPPPKDKSVVTPVATTPSTGYSYYNPLRAIYGSGSPTPSPNPSTSSYAQEPHSPDSSHGSTSPLSREKNRLTLRAYLNAILSLPYLLNSPIVRSFLLSAPTILTPPEAVDCQRRLEADAVREEGRRRFREEAERRVEALREGLAQFKGDVLSQEGGLKGVFEVVRRVERVEDLPKAEASVLEWGRISLAFTVFQLFVASDTASDTLANLKRLHGLMPYFVLKGILKISNPMAMIRGVLDLFLARPFGGQSLIQRMFSTTLTEDVRLIQEDIDAVAEKIDDPVLCQKIEQYASAPFEIQEIYRRDAVQEGLDLLVVILRSPDPPTLSRPQFQRVFRASRAYKEYKTAQADLDDSDDDLGPDNDDAWLFEDLNILMKLWQRKREKEGLLALIFEGVTAELLKDIITIFYAPLAQVYKAANIADSIGDMQNFLNDMIRTVEQVEELSQEDPGRTVQTFIDLVQRHEQSFYSFVHNVHSKGQGLFDSLMSWIELFLSYARDGLPQPVDLDFILPHAGPERAAIMAEVDAVAQYHYRLKVSHEEKVRRRFDRSVNKKGDGEEAALLDSVMASLSLGDGIVGEAGEIEDEEGGLDSEDEEDEYDPGQEEGEGYERSGQSSRRDSGSAGSSVQHIPMVTPDHLDPNLPSLRLGESGGGSGKKEKHRRTSHGGGEGKSGMDKIRSSLDFSRKSVDLSADGGEKEKDKDKKRPVPVRIPREHGGGNTTPKVSAAKRARRRAAEELLTPPETRAIEELRPLFVEMVRPLLRVKKIS